ncbi:MAG TPA: nicotinate-nucleotide--dimethylbenzimidazole phosphoribosyltransferase, partial [Microscillaceae bacterium]|nr:nicotinate-nucleotide--dimethylbenzimidazole phosphoribosyltransferase [Microscillaceae bacterium]
MHYPDFTIRPLDSELGATIQGLIDQKTKPTGSLGLLEQLALQVALIQNTPHPVLESPHLLIFAGDHGIAHERVSAYPQVVTVEMVKNYLAGGAAVNVFAKQNQWQLQIVDAGVAADLSALAGLVDQKIAKGTANFLHEPAMTQAQCTQAL